MECAHPTVTMRSPRSARRPGVPPFAQAGDAATARRQLPTRRPTRASPRPRRRQGPRPADRGARRGSATARGRSPARGRAARRSATEPAPTTIEPRREREERHERVAIRRDGAGASSGGTTRSTAAGRAPARCARNTPPSTVTMPGPDAKDPGSSRKGWSATAIAPSAQQPHRIGRDHRVLQVGARQPRGNRRAVRGRGAIEEFLGRSLEDADPRDQPRGREHPHPAERAARFPRHDHDERVRVHGLGVRERRPDRRAFGRCDRRAAPRTRS